MGGKAKIIVSDLHLGAGFAPDNPLEDFITDAEFAAFVSGIVAESDAQALDVELIINGDMVEFLQAPAVDTFDPRAVYPPEAYHPSSEAASLKKILLVIQGHLTFFATLRNFLHPDAPRRSVTILKGNHDVNLHWRAVQDAIRQTLGATDDRQGLLIFEKRYISREGIYVEHGNQYTEKIDRLDNFEEPLDPQSPGELVTPPGSKFVIDFFNDVEREKWWVDSIKPITALLWYGFAIDFAFAARALVNFLKAAPILIVGSLAAKEGAGLRAQADELQQQLADEDEVIAMGQRYTTDAAFRREFDARLDQLLNAVAPPEVARPAAVAEAAARETEALERARCINEAVDNALRQAAQAKITQEHVEVVIFGHTHRPLCEKLDGGICVNSGTWAWQRNFAGMDLETWKQLYAHPENFTQPHYLTYARVDYDAASHPQVRVLDHTGQLVVECPTAPGRKGCAAWWAKFVALFTGKQGVSYG